MRIKILKCKFGRTLCRCWKRCQEQDTTLGGASPVQQQSCEVKTAIYQDDQQASIYVGRSLWKRYSYKTWHTSESSGCSAYSRNTMLHSTTKTPARERRDRANGHCLCSKTDNDRFGSQPVFVPKKDECLPICVDCRRLNSVVVPNSNLIGWMDDWLEFLGKELILSTLVLLFSNQLISCDMWLSLASCKLHEQLRTTAKAIESLLCAEDIYQLTFDPGLCNLYRQFVLGFSKPIAPLNNKTREGGALSVCPRQLRAQSGRIIEEPPCQLANIGIAACKWIIQYPY